MRFEETMLTRGRGFFLLAGSYLGLGLFGLIIPFETLAEGTDGAPHLAADFAEPPNSKKQDDDHQDDNKLSWAYVRHTSSPVRRSGLAKRIISPPAGGAACAAARRLLDSFIEAG
jgi:hypothetical protein